MKIDIFHQPPPAFEVAERKGIGHPDTLCDTIADLVSHRYARYCLREFDCVLNHNCDKLAIFGGKVELGFGHGRMLAPVRFLLSGRFSTHFGDREIPYREIADEAVRDVLGRTLRYFDPRNDVEIVDFTHSNPSPGLTAEGGSVDAPTSRRYYFRPRGVHDLSYLDNLRANDTSLGVGYAPYTLADRAAMALESWLTGGDAGAGIGTDVKIMATVVDRTVDVTAAIPLLAMETSSLAAYLERLDDVRRGAVEMLSRLLGDGYDISLSVNCRDRIELNEVYLTLTGSSIEMGDEGMVGRGNRINGVISNTRCISMEGASGKNPLFHVGKVYNIVADRIARDIYERLESGATVHVVSQTGRDLLDPWRVMVTLQAPVEPSWRGVIAEVVGRELERLPTTTRALIEGHADA